MAAYASDQRERSAWEHPPLTTTSQLAAVAPLPARPAANATDGQLGLQLESQVVNQLIEFLAERVAAAVAERLGTRSANDDDEWVDSRHAAEYLGVHRDTLRKLAAERAIPAEQDGPGCKLYFRRADLDVWRHSGGRPRHLRAALASVA
jgi:excisionase family DNA binding protein